MKIGTLRRFALSLPDTTEEPHFDYSSFRVCGKIFVTVPPPGEYIHVFVDDLQRERALALAPEWTETRRFGALRVQALRTSSCTSAAGGAARVIRNPTTFLPHHNFSIDSGASASARSRSRSSTKTWMYSPGGGTVTKILPRTRKDEKSKCACSVTPGSESAKRRSAASFNPD